MIASLIKSITKNNSKINNKKKMRYSSNMHYFSKKKDKISQITKLVIPNKTVTIGNKVS